MYTQKKGWKNTQKNRSGIQQASALKKNKAPWRREKHR